MHLPPPLCILIWDFNGNFTYGELSRNVSDECSAEILAEYCISTWAKCSLKIETEMNIQNCIESG